MEQAQKYIVLIKHILFNGWVISKEIEGEEALVEYVQTCNLAPNDIRIIKGEFVKLKNTIEVDKEAIFQKHAKPAVN